MANFREHIKSKNLLSDEQIKKIQSDANQTKSGTFYRSLINSQMLPESVIIQEACECFSCLRIADAYHTDIDFDLSFKLGTIVEIMERKRFFVRIGEEPICVIPNPENENDKSAAITAADANIRFALITSQQFEIFNQYQLKPKYNAVQSEIVAEQNLGGIASRKTEETTASAPQKLLFSLIHCALDFRASDMHIHSMGQGKDALVNFRVDGHVRKYTEIKYSVLENFRNLLKNMCKAPETKDSVPIEGQIEVEYGGKKIDTRVNVVCSALGYDFNLRFITSKAKSLSELGLSANNEEKFRNLLHLTKGLVLVCGPTGSGKTTLVYAGLKDLLDEGKNIFTMEDPVEIIVPGMAQINVNEAKGVTYESTFSTALRHDPDIILSGEIRTKDVANLALQASNTGHLVLATVHANDAVTSISRLLSTEVDPYILGDVLTGVVAQRLVRRVCPECKEEYMLPKNHRWRKMFGFGNSDIKLVRGKGCAKCAGTGYFDRICINEVMLVNPKVRDAIQTKTPSSVIEDALYQAGFSSFLDDGVSKALAGITTLDEIEKFYNDKIK